MLHETLGQGQEWLFSTRLSPIPKSKPLDGPEKRSLCETLDNFGMPGVKVLNWPGLTVQER